MKQEILKKLMIEKIYADGMTDIQEDDVISEERIDFYLNGTKLLSVMSLPYDQEAHIVGFLMSEGVIDSVQAISSLRVSDDGLAVFIEASIHEEHIQNLFKEKTLTTGCCVGVTGNIDTTIVKEFNRSCMRISHNEIFMNIRSFYEESELFFKSGCVHKAKLILEDKTIMEAEDVGRHNAIDKVIGKTRLQGYATHNSYLIVSGRLSMEMVVKCIMHKIPMVISKAAPTRLGVQTALAHGVTLVGFAREGRMNVYTHSSRIVCETSLLEVTDAS